MRYLCTTLVVVILVANWASSYEAVLSTTQSTTRYDRTVLYEGDLETLTNTSSMTTHVDPKIVELEKRIKKLEEMCMCRECKQKRRHRKHKETHAWVNISSISVQMSTSIPNNMYYQRRSKQ